MSLNNIELFREKVSARQVCAGCVISLTDPVVSELVAEAGYDFTWIDMEHAPLTTTAALHHIMALRGTQAFPLVRVPWNDQAILKQVRDLEPAGIIIPMIKTAEEAANAVAACKYPPQGMRGIGPKRGTRYGAISFSQYAKEADENCMVILQIEHIDAVRHIDEILDVPGIDSICIGPSDLSASMGKIAQESDPEVVAVIDALAKKVTERGIILGTASGDIQGWINRGVNWIAIGSDCGNMASHGRQALVKVKEMMQQPSVGTSLSAADNPY